MLISTDILLGPDPPPSAYFEGYRVLRANLLAMHAREPFNSILVTSALPREGKTTTAINLGTVLGLAGRRVRLIDADAGQHSFARQLGIADHVGLTDLCRGEAQVEDALTPTQIDGVHLLSAGHSWRELSELAISAAMAQAVQQVAKDADFTILDSRPILGFGATLSLATVVDTVVLVARARGDAGPVQRALATLEDVGARVSGVVVNDILSHDSAATDAYYDYHYDRE